LNRHRCIDLSRSTLCILLQKGPDLPLDPINLLPLGCAARPWGFDEAFVQIEQRLLKKRFEMARISVEMA